MYKSHKKKAKTEDHMSIGNEGFLLLLLLQKKESERLLLSTVISLESIVSIRKKKSKQFA